MGIKTPKNSLSVPIVSPSDTSRSTSSAKAEISNGPHKGGLKRAGPNDFMFVYNLVQRDLSISMLFVFIFLFC